MFTLLHKIRNRIRITGVNDIFISKTAKIRGCRITIKGKNNGLHICNNVNLRDSEIEIDGENCILFIGEDTIIGHNCYLSARERGVKLKICEGSMLSRNVKIMTSDGHNITKDGKRINSAQSIEIGPKVWLTDNVTVLKGVTVGEGSIIGINSTLTKSVPSGAIAVGNPAKVVQNGVSWQHELTY
ncbi:hexapeptide transferase [Vibrio coralliilyticus]|uniref:Hexapeptide transferase n=1 Tax=Vibrio coralliilyticus TaxID=190893 RepID=A0A837G5L2_9VIBR|nr:acyltransferase [Vibrio coralliilyticus]KJY78439.1 hexapeptide transferase [Vibrio coralliilyticus]QOU29766.1 acyltransferase [Vibrio coralliilyticus]